MKISKTITLELDDLSRAETLRVKTGQFRSISEYIRHLISEDLKKG